MFRLVKEVTKSLIADWGVGDSVVERGVVGGMQDAKREPLLKEHVDEMD
jgi:hypothetical protein